MRVALLLALLVLAACGGKHEGIATSPQQANPSTPADESSDPNAPGAPAEPAPGGDTAPPDQGPTQGPPPATPPPPQR
jgi:hypothetical protein